MWKFFAKINETTAKSKMAKGKMRSTVLDFSVFTGKHTGERIAKKLVEVMEEFNIADRVFSITLDNASNNKRAMKLRFPSGRGTNFLFPGKPGNSRIKFADRGVRTRVPSSVE